MTRYLITTADERTWKWDRPVLFLGEWCRLYERKPKWAGMDAVVAEPFGVDSGQKNRNLYYTLELSMRLLPEISRAMNAFHGENHGLRYWSILLGHWLQRFVAVTFNRYYTVQQVLSRHVISGTTVFDCPSYSLATRDTLSAIWSFHNDVWNHVLYAKVLRHIGGVTLDWDKNALKDVQMFKTPSSSGKRGGIKGQLLAAGGQLLRRFSRETDAFVVSSYLPLGTDFRLQIALGQCPQLWESLPGPDKSPDLGMRGRLKEVADFADDGQFESFVRQQVVEAMPTCYVEGYRDLLLRAESAGWPGKPRLIFTSNNYDTDEVFKTWAAGKAECDVPYFVGQHGNNYGTLIGSEYRPEVLTADRFISWGWSDGGTRIAPAFIFKLASTRAMARREDGDLLLVGLHAPHRMEPEDSTHEHGIYQQDQFDFLDALPERIRRLVRIRLHSSFREFRWREDLRWVARHPEAAIEAGEVRYQDSISRSRLAVYSYDSTGIMESLALNTPMIAFWRGRTDHVLPAARDSYEALFECGVFSDHPAKAAQTISLHWDHLHTWWASDVIQRARRNFCEAFARLDSHPVSKLVRILTSDIGKRNNEWKPT
jgi:putative transferase (TIGR04331 family)